MIKNAANREAVLADIQSFIESETPWNVASEMESPIKGDKGNVEFLVHLT